MFTVRPTRHRPIIELDGSSGGGQLVRTALSLADLSGEALRMWGDPRGPTEPRPAAPAPRRKLLVHLGIAGGRIAVQSVTRHVETSLSLLEQFGYDLRGD